MEEGLRRPLLRRQASRGNACLLEPAKQLSDEELTEAEDGPEKTSRWGPGCLCTALLLAVAGTALFALMGGPAALCRAEQHPQYPRFLVVGDWGRRGGKNQSAVAHAMARKAEALGPDFIVSTGDNMYPSGLLSPEDPAFDASFRKVYHQPSLQVPWHAVLGNHDYGEVKEKEAGKKAAAPCGSWDPGCYYSPLHELDVRLSVRDWRWHCERSFQLSLAGGKVELFFIDTTPILTEKYKGVAWSDHRGGLLEQSWEGQLRELEGRLARSEAEWKLVVGHHPIRTNHRPFHEFAEMVERLEPLLTRYGVQAYFNGHDHNLQHLHKRSTGFHQITCGAGSRVRPEFHGTKHSLFQYGANGFVAVRMAADSMRVEYVGLDFEEPLFSIDIPRRQ